MDDLLYLATSTPCVQHNGLICGGVVLSCLTLQQEKCEIKFTGGRRSLLSFSSIFKPSLDVKYKLARWLFSFHFHNPVLMFLICVTELSLSFCGISVVSQELLCQALKSKVLNILTKSMTSFCYFCQTPGVMSVLADK